jgi:hypothetical protein
VAELSRELSIVFDMSAHISESGRLLADSAKSHTAGKTCSFDMSAHFMPMNGPMPN